MTESFRRSWLLIALAVLAAPSWSRAAPTVDAREPELAVAARTVPLGGELRLRELFLETLGPVELELERFRVFAEDAVILAGDSPLPVPAHAYFRGRIAGRPGSIAVLSFKFDGAIDGLVLSAGELWRLASDDGRALLNATRLDVLEESRERPFTCDVPRLTAANAATELPAAAVEPGTGSLETIDFSYTARIAVDTDWEFLQKFGGDVVAATDYVGDLFAFSSAIYEAEVDTSLYIGYLKWWPGPSAGVDPWTESGCVEALGEFRGYWLSNRAGVERSTAHLLSGKSTGCGIAYLSALCSSSYGFGVSGSLSGRFDPLDPTSSSGFWDILVVSHELGHNFGSSHTHCYDGVLGNPDPVDECHSGEDGCYSGPESLPGCSPGGRCGTIMSYCHTISGGYGNISLTFGAGHPYGVAPWRVPTVMNNFVQSRAGSNPSCLAPIVPDAIFADDFESGGAGAWSASEPPLP